MKRVSFKVAKAIKEAGYPQKGTGIWYDNKGRFTDGCLNDKYLITPTYLEVWLWLWREKGITLEPSKEGILVIESENKNDNLYYGHNIFSTDENKDPEEAIIAAIEYLVENDLIK